jgi:hypothetical protein
MTGALAAIDCDVHPTVPDMTALLPYLDDFWRATAASIRSKPSPIRPTRR